MSAAMPGPAPGTPARRGRLTSLRPGVAMHGRGGGLRVRLPRGAGAWGDQSVRGSDRDRVAQQTLDVPEEGAFLAVAERERDSGGAGAPRAADAMDVRLRLDG